jgi:hypothetical protein
MKPLHIVLGAAALFAVGAFLYSNKAKPKGKSTKKRSNYARVTTPEAYDQLLASNEAQLQSGRIVFSGMSEAYAVSKAKENPDLDFFWIDTQTFEENADTDTTMWLGAPWVFIQGWPVTGAEPKTYYLLGSIESATPMVAATVHYLRTGEELT